MYRQLCFYVFTMITFLSFATCASVFGYHLTELDTWDWCSFGWGVDNLLLGLFGLYMFCQPYYEDND